MSQPLPAAPAAFSRLLVALACCLCLGSQAFAQSPERQPVQFRVNSAVERLEMLVNTSRILTLEHKVPQLLVDNPQIVRATPLSPTQIQLSALKAGFTQLNIWDENQRVYSIDVIVSPDARELENILMNEFPDATIRVRPLANSVIISGFVPSADMVRPIVSIAEDFFPKVQNNLTVGGVQQVLLHVKVMEVSRTKLRAVGFDWANLSGNNFVVQSVSGLITSMATENGVSTVSGSGGETMRFGIVDQRNAFFGFVEALRQYNLAKVLAEPTLVAMSGRPAQFHSGGEFGFLLPTAALMAPQVDFKAFGTQVEFVPLVLGNGNIRLEVRPTVSEIDFSLGANGVPGFRTRSVDTAVEMKAGQTLALAGLIQSRMEAENRGLPWLADLPWVGAAFRRVEEQVNEVELLILVTPELVDALDPHQVPPCGPGQLTTSPGDVDLYWRGYLEVPTCCSDQSCPSCRERRGASMDRSPSALPSYEEVAPGERMSSHRRARKNPSHPSLPDSDNKIPPAFIGPLGYDVLD